MKQYNVIILSYIYTHTHIKRWCTKIISLNGLTINLKVVTGLTYKMKLRGQGVPSYPLDSF